MITFAARQSVLIEFRVPGEEAVQVAAEDAASGAHPRQAGPRQRAGAQRQLLQAHASGECRSLCSS